MAVCSKRKLSIPIVIRLYYFRPCLDSRDEEDKIQRPQRRALTQQISRYFFYSYYLRLLVLFLTMFFFKGSLWKDTAQTYPKRR